MRRGSFKNTFLTNKNKKITPNICNNKKKQSFYIKNMKFTIESAYVVYINYYNTIFFQFVQVSEFLIQI